jgi:RimJ/RimL family protein N-acetyltransferase
MLPHPTPAEPSAASRAEVPGGKDTAIARFAPWIPIRSLSPRHRERILAHLMALSETDRYLRFGYAAGDTQIARYVAGLDFERDEVFGVYNRKLDLIALAHLAYPAADSLVPGAAEFGGSVVAHARGRGYGARLFEHAMLHARNRGLDTLFIHALSENTAMLRIARKAGARVERAGSETDAYLKLPHDTLASKVEQWVGEGAAELDYRLKRQAHLVDSLIDAIGAVKANMGKTNSPAAKD